MRGVQNARRQPCARRFAHSRNLRMLIRVSLDSGDPGFRERLGVGFREARSRVWRTPSRVSPKGTTQP